MESYKFIGKAVWIEKKKILVIGDIHLGYEQSLEESGILLPRQQYEETIKDLSEIFEKIGRAKELVILGDLKHQLSGNSNQEWNEVRKLVDYLKKNADKIVLIKGNHDNFLENIVSKYEIEVKDFYIKEDIAFIHGDKKIFVDDNLIKEDSFNNRKLIASIKKEESKNYKKDCCQNVKTLAINKNDLIKNKQIGAIKEDEINEKISLNANNLNPNVQNKMFKDNNELLNNKNIEALGDSRARIRFISTNNYSSNDSNSDLPKQSKIDIKNSLSSGFGVLDAQRSVNFSDIMESKNIKIIFMGHLHPAISIRENAKEEKYKCFLVGKHKNKQVVILPSFFPLVEGQDVGIENTNLAYKLDLKRFEVYIPDNNEILDFGLVRDVRRLR